MAASNNVMLFVLFLLAFSTVCQSLRSGTTTLSDQMEDCVYTFYIRTGSTIKAGTDSIISAKLSDGYGEDVEISDLEKWGGLMGPDYNYFERGNLDIFSGKARCLYNPVCALNLTSDGSGLHHGWYCNYVEVTTAGVHATCSQQLFTVEQWLSTDAKPYELTTFRSNCPAVAGTGKKSAAAVM